MSELKPCPFCRSDNVKSEEPLDVIYCLDCGAEMATDLGDWQSRPIEDELRKRIAELEAWIDKFIEEGEYLSLLNGLVNGDSDWGNLVADYWKERDE